MSEEIKVSIIVPVYNASKYIKKTIESVQNQTFTDWELILVDDASTDNSTDIIKEHLSDERISLYTSEDKLLAAGARNLGLEKAKGRYIAFIDADDLWMKDKLQKQLDFMNKNECAFSYTSYEFGDEEAVGTGKYVKVLPVMTYKQALSRTIIFTSTVMADTEKLPKELLNMPKVPSEDTATWWQILRNGYNAYGLNEVLTIYRRPAKSLSSNKKVALYRIWNLYRGVEKLGIFTSMINFIMWALRATLRRI